MKERLLDIISVGIAAVACWWLVQTRAPSPVVPAKPDAPAPAPVQPRRPWIPWREEDFAEAKVGGPAAPDGTEIHCDLPGNFHRRNTSSRGLGNCVFTSIHHSALWQNVPALQEFPKWLIDKGIPGGGYPEKVAKLIPQMCKDRGVLVPQYLQIEDSRDLEPLKLACRAGRMVAITYSRSPTNRYGGGRIAHMVSLPHCDDKWACVLDNNYPGADAYEWMDPQKELLGVANPGGYWAVILLDPPPMPIPVN